MQLSSLQKIQAVLTAAKTTNDMPVVVEWIDISTTALPSFQTTPTNTNGLTLVDIVAAPTTVIQRKIAALSVTNRDTATKTVEIYLNNNGTNYLLVSCQLSVGDMLGYSDTRGWYAQDQFGCEKTTVQLAYSVVITALGFTPENVANKSTDVALGASDTLYPTQNAVRTFVNNVAGGTSLDFFMSNTASDIGTYYTLLNNPSPNPETNVAVAITTNPTTIKTFATISTEPSITSLISGAYTFHIHAAQTAGTKTSTIYANFYTRTSGGAETLRATSESSIPLTAISTGYDLNFTIPTDISINSTDRIVLEILGVPAGVGTTPTITIYMEGTTASRIEFRTTSAANDTRYLVKNGLSGGQIAIGGLNTGDDLLFQSTSHATKGYVGFGNLTTGFIYDEANNRIGFGVIPLNFLHVVLPSTDNMYIDGRTHPRDITVGVVRIDHTANIPGTRPLNIDIICAGHADTHAVNVDYHTTNMVAGDDSHIYDVHVDTANSTGGMVAAISVSKSGSGTIAVRAIEAYHGVQVLEHRVGTLTIIEQAWTYTGVYTDVTTAFGSAVTDVQIFAALNDYIYIGMAGTFDDIEVILSIAASGAGIKPVFQYSAGAGVWTTFTPVDGTNGFRTNGNISWTLPLAGWATDTVNAVTKYWVRIQRTQVTLATPPTEDTIKVFSSTYYKWDENGNVSVKTLTESISPSITAAGATQGTATAITSTHNIITSAAAGTGVILDAPASGGAARMFDNDAANTVLIYPHVGGTINGGAVNSPYTIQVGGFCKFVSTNTTNWDTEISQDMTVNTMKAVSGYSAGTGTVSATIPVSITTSANTIYDGRIRNNSTGTAGSASWNALNSLGEAITMRMHSSGFTTAGLLAASKGILHVDSSAGLIIAASHASGIIDIAAGGTATANRAARVTAAQNWLIGGTTTDSTKAQMQFSAGTTTKAPLQIVAGTNLTTTQAGIVEFDGSKLYFSPDTTRRRVKVSDDVTLPSAITVGASPFTYQNATNYDADVLVSGGTVSLVEFTRDNSTFYTWTDSFMRLSPGDRIRVTYTVAPTMTHIPR